MIKRLVLAYSGGLETSVAIPWLAEKYGAEIITVSMDLGQGKELDDVRDRALASGALRAHVLDLREELRAISSCPRFRPARSMKGAIRSLQRLGGR